MNREFYSFSTMKINTLNDIHLSLKLVFKELYKIILNVQNNRITKYGSVLETNKKIRNPRGDQFVYR